MGLPVEEIYDYWANSVSLTDRVKEAFLTTAKTGEGVRNIMSMLGAYKVGQVHQLFETRAHRRVRTMVKLLRSIPSLPDDFGGVSYEWEVEDLRTGRKEIVDEPYLSLSTYNEMEVIAWASR